MGPWVVVAGAAAVLAVVAGALSTRAGRRTRAQLVEQLAAAQADVRALSERIEALSDDVAEARRAAERRDAAPTVVTGLVLETEADVTPREAQLVQAIEAGRPQWVPAKPLRETLIRSVSLGHGVRRALGPDMRDRIMLEMRAEVRRSRRQRKAELKAVRKYLRDRRKSAA
ncbi:MAG TPA: hypothetical protein VFK52_02565 [Nocardioidaceae bacterium]|nr:hypothetical protein [Nocardioidaceae bacterium]